MDTISIMLHVLFATMLVGPQLLLALAVSPATWLIDDEALRRRVTRVVTARFAAITGIAVIGLLVTGLFQFYQDDFVPSNIRDEMVDYRWGLIFMVKMTGFTLLIVMIAVHAMVFGPRIRRASEAVERGVADAGALEQQRRNSFLFSIVMLLVSIAVLFLGATLGHHPYSFVQR